MSGGSAAEANRGMGGGRSSQQRSPTTAVCAHCSAHTVTPCSKRQAQATSQYHHQHSPPHPVAHLVRRAAAPVAGAAAAPPWPPSPCWSASRLPASPCRPLPAAVPASAAGRAAGLPSQARPPAPAGGCPSLLAQRAPGRRAGLPAGRARPWAPPSSAPRGWPHNRPCPRAAGTRGAPWARAHSAGCHCRCPSAAPSAPPPPCAAAHCACPAARRGRGEQVARCLCRGKRRWGCPSWGTTAAGRASCAAAPSCRTFCSLWRGACIAESTTAAARTLRRHERRSPSKSLSSWNRPHCWQKRMVCPSTTRHGSSRW